MERIQHFDSIDALYLEAIEHLSKLIRIPSWSKQEDEVATLLTHILTKKNIQVHRHLNNLYCMNEYYDSAKPSILLNTHHDTVKPNSAYTNNPFDPIRTEDKLFGLGSTDAGASLVSLMATFFYFYERKDLSHNFILALTAEEEISGKNGIESILPLLPNNISFAIVGEPTQMDLAIAEKGLMVLDCESLGVSGHAARKEGKNAIMLAIQDILWFDTYQFEKISPYLGENKMTVTMIQAGLQHNIIPATCQFSVDIRLNELYTHDEVLDIIKEHTKCIIRPRSLRLKSTFIDPTHPIVQAGLSLQKKIYGSPTTSDKALLPFQTLKCGPGFSAQSHSADEFVHLSDIREGISTYVQMLEYFFMQH